jgi:hypothetical protein
MYRILIFANLTCLVALGAVEDGATQCADGVDNDFDGVTDCQEMECVSSLETCGLLAGPIGVGLGSDRDYITFDVPMATLVGTLSASDALVLDINGALTNSKDDVIVPQPSNMRVFRNVVTPGYASIPRNFTLSAGFLAGGPPRYAAGDFSGDGIPDLFGNNGQNSQRYVGNGAGQFAALPTTFGGSGLPAIVGRTAALASTRLRLFDQRCTVAPPGFPTTETFTAGGLCASVDLPGTSGITAVSTARVGARNFILTVNGSNVAVYEVVVTSVILVGTSVNAVLRSTASLTDDIVGPRWHLETNR